MDEFRIDVDYEDDYVDLLEFGLSDNEIDELIDYLFELKENRRNFVFDIDSKNSLLIHHEEDENWKEVEDE